MHRPQEEQLQRIELSSNGPKKIRGMVFHPLSPHVIFTGENPCKAMQDEPNTTIRPDGTRLDHAGKNLEAQDKITVPSCVGQMTGEHPLFKPDLEKSRKGWAAWAGKRDSFVIRAHRHRRPREGFAGFVKIAGLDTAWHRARRSPTDDAAGRKVAG